MNTSSTVHVTRPRRVLGMGAAGAMLGLIVAACSGGDSGGCGGLVDPLRVVTPSPTSVSLDVGASTQVSVSLSGGCDGDDRTVTWVSSDTVIARVDATGRVTGVGGGSTIVTISAFSNRARATIPVVVLPRVPTTIDAQPDVDTLSPLGARTLTVAVRDQNGVAIANAPVVWRTLTPNLANVTVAGVATAIAAGTASIEASTPRAGADSLRDTVRILVVPACSLVRPVTLGATVNGSFDASTCQNQFGYRLLNLYSITASTQAYYSVRVTPTVQTALVPLNIGASLFGLPSADTAVTGLVVVRAGTYGFLITAPATTPGTYSVATALNPDPRLGCLTTDATTGVTFNTALTASCTGRDVRLLPALANGQQVRITASAASFPVVIELLNAANRVVIQRAQATGNGAVATIALTNTVANRLVILRVSGGAGVNDLVAVTIAQ
jgi:Bacterial Ig-like domain (group 2)